MRRLTWSEQNQSSRPRRSPLTRLGSLTQAAIVLDSFTKEFETYALHRWPLKINLYRIATTSTPNEKSTKCITISSLISPNVGFFQLLGNSGALQHQRTELETRLSFDVADLL